MGLAFHERMRGHLRDPGGGCHLVDMDLVVEATHAVALLRTGLLRVTGVLRAPPWAHDAAVEGTLHIAPLRGRSLEYRLDFTDSEDRPARLWGRKDLRADRPVGSLTQMRAELRRGEAVLAAGAMAFDLNDLLAFLTSLRPWTAFRRIDLDGVGASPGQPDSDAPLEGTEVALLQALAGAIIEPGVCVPAADATTVARARALLGQMPPGPRQGYRQALHTLDRLARLRRGEGFAALPRRRQDALLERLRRGGALRRGLYTALCAPIKIAHLGRRDYLDALGLPPASPLPPQPAPRWAAKVHTPDALERETELPADVVVIGSGAGGAAVAARLAERGLAVALIEEGAFADRASFHGDHAARIARFWRQGGMSLALGNTAVVVPTGRLVGGTTAINSGTCMRTPDPVLRAWRAEGLPEDFEPERFARWLDQVEAELQVAPAAPEVLGAFAQVVARGADAMGMPHGPLRRNAPGCDGQGQCIFGCPSDAKRSTNLSYMPRALRAGAHLFTGMQVTRLLRRGARITAVEARGQTPAGAPRRLRVRARAVVVACGALQSPLLLARGGVRLPWLGRNLSIHPTLGVFARCGHDLEPWRGVPQSYGVEDRIDPRVRYEGFYAPPGLSAIAYPMHGAELTRWMDAQRRVGQFGFLVRDQGAGRVRLGPGGAPLLTYHLSREVLGSMRRGLAVLAELLLRGGAEEVMVGVGDPPSVRSVEAARRLAERPLRARELSLSGYHPLGTCRVAADPARGVVDADHRVFDTDNLYVIDGASVPSSLGVNPQVTIMAMAERAAERLGQRLG